MSRYELINEIYKTMKEKKAIITKEIIEAYINEFDKDVANVGSGIWNDNEYIDSSYIEIKLDSKRYEFLITRTDVCELDEDGDFVELVEQKYDVKFTNIY